MYDIINILGRSLIKKGVRLSMNNEDKILTMLENIQKQIGSMENRFDTMESNTNNRFDTMDNRFDTMDNRFDAMDNRFDTMESNTNNRFDAMEKFIAKEIQSTRDELKLEIQHVYDEVKEIKDDFNNIEQVTAKNWLDISRLKAVR